MKNKRIDINKYNGITADSRDVQPNFIYVAIKGSKADGDGFIEDAIKSGATLIITHENSNYESDLVEVRKVEDPRAILSKLAYEKYSLQPDNIVAVTGTSGKTSVVYMYMQIAELLGYKSASIGTLGVVSNFIDLPHDNSLTSPSTVELNKTLNLLHQSAITHVALEASSHGIDQKRIDNIDFKAIAFTNLSQDHLDYHHNMDDYFNAKLRIFTDVLKNGYAVLNADIPQFDKMIDVIKNKHKNKILSYGQSGSHIKLISAKKPQLILEILGTKFTTDYYPEGHFQIYNLMAAIGLAIATNMKPHEIIEIVPKLKAAPGRLEEVAIFNGAKIFVDYSHKPDPLEKALVSLKSECEGKLYVIFGCGGDRDKGKRPLMGKIAEHNADCVIVTDDNPRTENASIIRREILASCPNAIEYDERAKAIAETIKKLKPKDALLIAGKGHETYQIIGDKTIHFSDTEEVLKAVSSYN